MTHLSKRKEFCVESLYGCSVLEHKHCHSIDSMNGVKNERRNWYLGLQFQYTVKNCLQYDPRLIDKGSLTLWIFSSAIKSWVSAKSEKVETTIACKLPKLFFEPIRSDSIWFELNEIGELETCDTFVPLQMPSEMPFPKY